MFTARRAAGHVVMERAGGCGAKGVPSDAPPLLCHDAFAGTFIRRDQAFGWECIMTVLLTAVVYAVAIGKPGFGNIGPLAVGFTLFASAFIGEPAMAARCMNGSLPARGARCSC